MNEREVVRALAALFAGISEELRRLAEEDLEPPVAVMDWPRRRGSGSTEPTPSLDDNPGLID